MIKGKKNILIYIYILVGSLLIISLFNYIVDPHDLFHKKEEINISGSIIDFPYIPIKLHKKYKYDYVLSGGSIPMLLKLDCFNHKIANIGHSLLNIENSDKILFNFLNLHKETKTALLIVDLCAIASKSLLEVPEYTGNNLNFKEIHKVFLSQSTTKKSLQKLFNKKQRGFSTYIKQCYNGESISKNLYLERGKKIYKKINLELKKRNIKTIYYTAPISAYAQFWLWEHYNENIFEMKKFIVEETGSLIDFAILNKHTTLNLADAFYLYKDAMHPIKTYGYYVYAALFDTPYKDEDLYVVLTKENVDYELKKQKEELLKWGNEHQKEYQDYLNIKKEPAAITKNINDFPPKFREIMEKY